MGIIWWGLSKDVAKAIDNALDEMERTESSVIDLSKRFSYLASKYIGDAGFKRINKNRISGNIRNLNLSTIFIQ